MSARCVSCHSTRRPNLPNDPNGYSSTTKQQIANEVNRNAMPPGGGLSDADKQAILDWANSP
jgi:mono/diheme cytochrome c family protein